MKKEFIDAIESNDIITVRIIISNELLINPQGDTYREMKEYAEANIPNLYEAHDGAQLEINEDNLSVDLLVQLKNDLDSNFSCERIAVYERVAEIVLHNKMESDKQAEHSKGEECENGDNRNKLLGIGVATGLGTMIYGICKGNSLTTVSGATVAAVSGIKLFNKKKNGK